MKLEMERCRSSNVQVGFKKEENSNASQWSKVDTPPMNVFKIITNKFEIYRNEK